jgi:hypothetical protein
MPAGCQRETDGSRRITPPVENAAYARYSGKFRARSFRSAAARDGHTELNFQLNGIDGLRTNLHQVMHTHRRSTVGYDRVCEEVPA